MFSPAAQGRRPRRHSAVQGRYIRRQRMTHAIHAKRYGRRLIVYADARISNALKPAICLKHALLTAAAHARPAATNPRHAGNRCNQCRSTYAASVNRDAAHAKHCLLYTSVPTQTTPAQPRAAPEPTQTMPTQPRAVPETTHTTPTQSCAMLKQPRPTPRSPRPIPAQTPRRHRPTPPPSLQVSQLRPVSYTHLFSSALIFRALTRPARSLSK